MAESNNPYPNFKPRGGSLAVPTSFEGGEYTTKGLMFPDDLMKEQDNPYGGNYVIFYVNVHEDSVLAKGNTAAYVPADKVSPREQGELKGRDFSSATLATVGAGAVAATAQTAGIAQKVAGAGGADLSSRGSTVLNLGGGAALGGAIIKNIGGPKAEYKRQRRAIALYIPNDVSIKYGMQWEADSMAGTTALLEGAAAAPKALLYGGLAAGGGAAIGAALGGRRGAIAGAVLGGAAGAGAAMAGPAVDYSSNLAMNLPVGTTLAKTSGTAANPKKEQLFKEVDYRTFSFNYQFFPRDKAESANVLEIIKEFKLHMHPEYRPNTNQFLYIYPSEFDIFYYQNGKENLNLHRHTSCVLTDLSVMYSPQGIFTTFEDGMPTQINLQMTFKELALLSKQQIADGY